jgi:hypothetical protein
MLSMQHFSNVTLPRLCKAPHRISWAAGVGEDDAVVDDSGVGVGLALADTMSAESATNAMTRDAFISSKFGSQ